MNKRNYIFILIIFQIHIGEAYSQKQEISYHEMIEIANVHIRGQTSDPFYYNMRAFSYFHLGKYKKAITDYHKSLKINPNDYEVYYNIGLSYKELDDDSALYYLKKTIELNNTLPDPYASIGNYFLNKKEFHTAIKWCNDALKIDDNYVYAFYNKGLAYMKLQLYDKAIENFYIVKHHSNSIYYIGYCYYHSGRYRDSLEKMTSHLENSTFNKDLTTYYIGMAYYRINKEEESCKYLRLIEQRDTITVFSNICR